MKNFKHSVLKTAGRLGLFLGTGVLVFCTMTVAAVELDHRVFSGDFSRYLVESTGYRYHLLSAAPTASMDSAATIDADSYAPPTEAFLGDADAEFDYLTTLEVENTDWYFAQEAAIVTQEVAEEMRLALAEAKAVALEATREAREAALEAAREARAAAFEANNEARDAALEAAEEARIAALEAAEEAREAALLAAEEAREAAEETRIAALEAAEEAREAALLAAEEAREAAEETNSWHHNTGWKVLRKVVKSFRFF